MIRQLSVKHIESAGQVLADAFADYPVMGHLIGNAGPAFAVRVAALLEYFVAARTLRGGLVLGVESDHGPVAAVALVTTGSETAPSAALLARREALWRALGTDALARYQQCGDVWRKFAIDRPHYHLNLIGVRRAEAGRGLGRRLLEEIHRRSAADPQSEGVTLTTEDPANVPLYQRFGYRVIGEETLAPGIRTWGFFRPNDGGR